jgi:hypothetical protein
MPELIYEVQWRCIYCDPAGIPSHSASISTNQSCLELFAQIEEIHEMEHPNCFEVRGNSGIAIRPPDPPGKGERR